MQYIWTNGGMKIEVLLSAKKNVAHIFGVNLNFFCPILDVKKRYLNILLWAKVSEKCNLGTRKMLIAKNSDLQKC